LARREVLQIDHSPKYRRDIDGLRAIAVGSVLAYHAFPSLLPGGFVGVDIFFVISGFLISTIILGNLEGDGFSYRDFYARRIKRIFPALLVVLAATCAIGWSVLLPRDLAQLGKHAAAGAAFVSNFAFWNEAGYFDTAAETKPLLHLWSLAIEEQFYLLWPLLLGLAWRRRWSFVAIIAVVAVASFACNIFTVYGNPTAAFYSPASRFWELMVGGMLACIRLRRPSSTGAWAHVQSIAGVALILAGLLLIRSTAAFPGWWALLPAIGAYLCIAAGPAGVLNRTLLASRPMVWVGLISYPLYLWHWPLLVYARILEIGDGHWSVRAGALGLSVVLAYATYRLIERPIRFGTSHPRARLAGLAAPMVLICAVGIAALLTNGFGFRLKGTPLEFASHEYNFAADALVGKCWVGAADAPGAYAGQCAPGQAGLLIWGDSHAGRFAPGLRRAVGDGVPLAEFTRDGCPGILGFGYPSCVAANEHVLEQIKKIRPHTVILFGSWTFYLPPVWSLKVADLQGTVDALKAAGVAQIIVMGPAPKWSGPLPTLLAKYHRQHPDQPVPIRTTFGLTTQSAQAEADLAALVAQVPSVEYFSTYSRMCDAAGCMTMRSNSPEGLTTWDYGHLTTSGADFVAAGLMERFPDLGRTSQRP
jgi:peptidoglycan/LPS O-acetylase OafA/YrhL